MKKKPFLITKYINTIEEKYVGKMYSHFKNDLIEIIITCLDPIKQEYDKIINDKDYLNKVLKEGSEKASLKARKTISKVYRKIGFFG